MNVKMKRLHGSYGYTVARLTNHETMKPCNHETVKQAFLFITLFLLTAFLHPSHAATLQFKPSTVSANVGDTFDLEVVVDAETKEILAVDALFQYDKSMLSIEGITDGTYLEIAQKESAEKGKGYIAGVVETPGTSVTGKGTLATVKFKTLASGKSKITYICNIGDKTESNISESTIDAPDLIDCSSNGIADVTVGGGVAPTKAAGSTTPPGTLPKTGLLDNLIIYSVAGGALLILGVGARLLL